MCDFSPYSSDCERRALPDRPSGRTSLPSASSKASGTTSSEASSTSPSSVSGGSHSPSAEPFPAALCPGRAGSPLPPTRAQLTRVACEACRRRRTKCSGDRPKCAACVRNSSGCTYQSLSVTETNSQAVKRRLKEIEDENDIFKELYEHLKTGPESQAHEIVRRIRMGDDAGAIVRQIQDGELLVQFALVPETRFQISAPD